MLTSESKISVCSRVLVLVIASMFGGCVEPFDAGSISYTDQLVVDGFITNEFKQHQVTISHTSAINVQQFIPEERAKVSVSDKTGLTIPLTEISPGIYVTSPLAGQVGNKYTLHFQTATGKAYVSSEVE